MSDEGRGWLSHLLIISLPSVRSRTNCIPRAKGRSCSSTDLREDKQRVHVRDSQFSQSFQELREDSDVGSPLPECDNDGWGLGTGRDEGDDEEEDEKGDEGVAGAITLPRHGVAVLVQVRFDDDQLELVDLAAGGRSDDLSALHAAAVGVVPYL